MMSTDQYAARRLLLLLVAATSVGCSSGGIDTYPVEGKVIVKGEPASGALVVFHPVSPPPSEGPTFEKPRGNVAADGSFKLTTLEDGDGAPAGEYTVTIQWWKLRQEGKDAIAGPNVVPSNYAQPQTTPIKVTIQAGENRLEDFQIR
jgi:hypothetical protein